MVRADDYHALGAFRYAMRKFLRFSKAVLADAELTPEQYEALLSIKNGSNGNGLNIRDLSVQLQVRHHSAVSLVNKLAARKMVAKKRAAHDRREVLINLTSLGDSTLASLAEIHRQEIRMRSAEIIDALQRLQK